MFTIKKISIVVTYYVTFRLFLSTTYRKLYLVMIFGLVHVHQRSR